MSVTQNIFFEVPCLTEQSTLISGLSIQKKWFKGADKRIIGQYLQKFISYNSELFSFLGVTPFIVGSDQNTSIGFRTSNFVGTIPLRAPDTGKQIGDFIVVPRYTTKDRYEDYIRILELLDEEITYEQKLDSLPLVSGRNFRPPLYLEAVKFIKILERVCHTRWHKFDRVEKNLREPDGPVNWRKYLARAHKVEMRQVFPVAKSILSENHSEYRQMKYVFDLCRSELLSSYTPLRLRSQIQPSIQFLGEKMAQFVPLEVSTFQERFVDTPLIRKLKTQANNVLQHNVSDSVAWRVDFSEVFERFVQHIFKGIAQEHGARLLKNHKMKGYSSNPSAWELRHLEPDAILQTEDVSIFIDAKYKAHLYNRYSTSEDLKEEHRRDLHQIMAYMSFSKGKKKQGVLCYPSNEVSIKQLKYINSIGDCENTVKLVGIPLNVTSYGDVSKALALAIS